MKFFTFRLLFQKAWLFPDKCELFLMMLGKAFLRNSFFLRLCLKISFHRQNHQSSCFIKIFLILRCDRQSSRSQRDFLLLRLDQQSSRNVRRIFFKLGKFPPEVEEFLESSISQKTGNFFRVGFFIFRARKVPS